MEVTVQWFGLAWALASIVAAGAAVAIAVVGRRTRPGRVLLAIGALVEVVTVCIDPVVRLSRIGGESRLTLLDVWVISATLLRGIGMALIAAGIARGMAVPDPSSGGQGQGHA